MELGDLEFGAQAGLDPSRDERRADEVLATTRRVAVIGASDNELRKSYRVVRFLADHGIDVVPVPDPAAVEAVDPPPEAVIVFCKPPELGPLASELAGSKVAAIWFQEGLIDPAAARLLEAAGKVAIMDRCVMRDYRRLILGEEVESWFPV
jgi:predicted CoA-binding protein